MAERDWDIVLLHRATDLLQQAERIQRNYLQIAAGARFRSAHGRRPSWEPPVNVVESDESFWVILAIPGVAPDGVAARLEGPNLVIEGDRPLPGCCQDGELKIWEIPLGRFERRIRLPAGEHRTVVRDISLQNGLLIIELRKQT